MKETEELHNHDKEIEKMAFDYWNFDILPPIEKWRLVLDYIADHPEKFKGLIPQ